MFEGENQITFSKETAYHLLSSFMTNLFNSPLKVTGIEKDYKGLTIDFTEAITKEKEDKEESEREV